MPTQGGICAFYNAKCAFLTRAVTLLIGLLLLLTIIEPASANDNVGLRWNEATLDAIRNTKSALPIAAGEAIWTKPLARPTLPRVRGRLFPQLQDYSRPLDKRDDSKIQSSPLPPRRHVWRADEKSAGN